MLSLGIDIGTSGVRAVVLNEQQSIIAQAQCDLEKSSPFSIKEYRIIGYSQSPQQWWTAVENTLLQIKALLHKDNIKLDAISHLALDGTSGTVLLADKTGTPLCDALMYNDQRCTAQAAQIKKFAPDNTAAIGVTSGLAKLIWLYQKQPQQQLIRYALNQADWIAAKLSGQYGISDVNNALKMGYDAQSHCWPDWVNTLLIKNNISPSILPQVISPGKTIATVADNIAEYFGFSKNLKICAGTTDSTAAIIASGAAEVGQAVTSLGSSLVMKVISRKAIFDQQSGVYSQPYGKLWLVGGSSNSGGEVIKQFFNSEQVSRMTSELDHKVRQKELSLLDLNYYPLATPGERFPVQNPLLEPKFLPKAESEIDFFQALLEGMADIETLAYNKLLDLGAPYPKRVISIGGGAFNKSWRTIREKKLAVPVIMAEQQAAAAGAAILAQSSWHKLT